MGGEGRRLRVAVVIPCHNDGSFIRDAVDSLRDQEPHEAVIVDDGSSDSQTTEVLRALAESGVRVLRQERAGVAAARMAGVRATTAPYVLALDADDRLAPGALTVLADALESDPTAGLVWGDVRVFGTHDHVIRSSPRLDPWRITLLNEISPACFVREALETVGGWDEESGYEDWDLWMKFAEHGFSGVHIPVVTYLYRRHNELRRRRVVERCHDEEMALLRARHPILFARRTRAWRASPSSAIVKVAFPIVMALPVISELNKMKFLYVVRNIAEPDLKSPEFPGPKSLALRGTAATATTIRLLAGRITSTATEP